MGATRIPGTKRTKNGNIAAYVRVGGRSGKQIQKTFPRGTQRYFIEDWRSAMRKQYEAEQRDPGSLGDAIDLYLASLGPEDSRRRKSAHTSLSKWRAAFGHQRRLSLTYEQCRDFLAKMRAEGYAASSLNKLRVYLMNVWRYCDGDNAACPIRGLKREREPEPSPRGQDPVIIRKAIDFIPVCATRARITLLATTGMRPAEVMRLGPGDLQLNAEKPYVTVPTAKGGQPRIVPLNPDGVAAAKLFNETKAFGSFSLGSLRVAFSRALAQAGVVNDVMSPDESGRGRKRRLWRFSPYVMRHTVATELRRQGTDLADIGYLLGHKSPTTTQRYARVDTDKLHEAMAKLATQIAVCP